MWIDELASKMFHFHLLEIFWAKFHKIKIFTNIFVFYQSKHVHVLQLQELKNQVEEARQALQKNIAEPGEKKCKRKILNWLNTFIYIFLPNIICRRRARKLFR